MWEPKSPTHAFLGGAIVAAVAAAFVLATRLTEAQGAPATIPRFVDGHVNLSGIWQANNTANWDILTRQARQGPLTALGAAFSVPGGIGVVEGNEISYKPEALAKKQQNAFSDRTERDDQRPPHHL
jgi:hypothetical protein